MYPQPAARLQQPVTCYLTMRKFYIRPDSEVDAPVSQTGKQQMHTKFSDETGQEAGTCKTEMHNTIKMDLTEII
jgi:hypothetical protein